MMNKLILFLIRRKYNLRKGEYFQFCNQNSNALYYFKSDGLYKLWRGITERSHVSLNWLLDKNCKIEHVEL